MCLGFYAVRLVMPVGFSISSIFKLEADEL